MLGVEFIMKAFEFIILIGIGVLIAKYSDFFIMVISFIIMIVLIIVFYDDIFDSKNVLTEIHQIRSVTTNNQQLQSAQSIYRNNLPKLTQRTKTSGVEVVYDENGIQLRREFLEQQEERLKHQYRLETNEMKRMQISQLLQDIEREKNDLTEVERIRRDLANRQYSF